MNSIIASLKEYSEVVGFLAILLLRIIYDLRKTDLVQKLQDFSSGVLIIYLMQNIWYDISFLRYFDEYKYVSIYALAFCGTKSLDFFYSYIQKILKNLIEKDSDNDINKKL